MATKITPYEYKRETETSKVWWVVHPQSFGEMLFTFDKKKIYNLFRDYPQELSEEERAIFDKENPFWADFFAARG